MDKILIWLAAIVLVVLFGVFGLWLWHIALNYVLAIFEYRQLNFFESSMIYLVLAFIGGLFKGSTHK